MICVDRGAWPAWPACLLVISNVKRTFNAPRSRGQAELTCGHFILQCQSMDSAKEEGDRSEKGQGNMI